jgi:hypothetical protein
VSIGSDSPATPSKRRGSYPRWKHGTANGYNNHRCRCEPCRAAWREYHRPYQRQADGRKRSRAKALAILERAQAKDARRWRVWSFSLYKEKDGATVYLTADAAAYRRWREAERASA